LIEEVIEMIQYKTMYYPSYAADLNAVQENGLYLKYIEKQDHHLCSEAIKQNPRAIKYVKNQTEDLCLIDFFHKLFFIQFHVVNSCN